MVVNVATQGGQNATDKRQFALMLGFDRGNQKRLSIPVDAREHEVSDLSWPQAKINHAQRETVVASADGRPLVE